MEIFTKDTSFIKKNIEYLKNQNDDCIYEFKKTGEIYEYNGPDLKTVHFIFNKHYIDILRSRK